MPGAFIHVFIERDAAVPATPAEQARRHRGGTRPPVNRLLRNDDPSTSPEAVDTVRVPPGAQFPSIPSIRGVCRALVSRRAAVGQTPVPAATGPRETAPPPQQRSRLGESP